MLWTPRGKDGSGFVQPGVEGQSSAVPALATHRGELWCLWSDKQGGLYYAIGDNDVFRPRTGFPDSGIPIMEDVLGILHAIVIRQEGEMAHYVYDDDNSVWGMAILLDVQVGFLAHSTPSLVSFHNKLFLSYIKDSKLMFSIYNLAEETWSLPEMLSQAPVSGIPALFVLNQDLHILCDSAVEGGDILGFAYSVPEGTWSSSDDVSEGKSAVGVSATSFGPRAFLAFQENGTDDNSHNIFIAEYSDGSWKPQETVAGQASADPPQLAVLNGQVHCIFNAHDDKKDLLWYSRPLLDYSLNTWMSDLPDQTLLSDLTIPGTHDSCARSSIPFVRTQYLSITKQMLAGLRFLDLRLRLDEDDGILYCYHGGIAIDWPRGLKFTTVMDEVFNFMSQNTFPLSEAVVVSINNDDISGKRENINTLFYNAVKTTISETTPWTDGSPKWIASNTTSTLGEARGKAVLLRRYQADPDVDPSELIGIDLSGWLNNNPDFTLTTASNTSITIQDKWQYLDLLPLAGLVDSKFTFVNTMFDKAASGAAEEWYINFCSAVGVPSMKGEVAESHWIAVGAHSNIIGKFVQGVNPTAKSMRWGGRRRFGIVPMDYPELPKESDLISKLIESNWE